ncbi:hypothetical protein PV08_00741 [Exophiala spinifera]|uniref:Uncharacterized protein n=1 Tax=Exophiala spinifera TaxID=91928 RepID=A0A0D1YY12_9EURO|nr:uncharacterized protein PV08_00741 [Exophiala spinifera]KIW20166.1 hypothetical protein PV08_00741 [Exophiala spinifera]
MLGKRKREIAVAPRRRPRISTGDEDSNPTTSADASHDVFRKYFESAFEPLPDSKTAASLHSEGDDGSGSEGAGASPAGDEDNNSMSEESAWEGLSDTDQQDEEVVVVEHNSIAQDLQDLESHKEQYKTFMSTKPPKDSQRATKKPPEKMIGEDDALEAQNLKHDLDLQRLLRESHLLEQAKSSSMPGAERHKAIDMRMKSLGSKDSLFHQKSMPRSHRVGIVTKAASREALRRKEAKENGIILEKPSGESRPTNRRERGVDVPAVGRFRSGTLKLSRKDVLDIQRSGGGGGHNARRKRH